MTRLRVIKAFDGVSIAAHELRKVPNASKRVLFSHATGFHGLVFNQTMQALSSDHDVHCMSIDHRGHGLTKYINNANGKDTWEMFGDDALAASHVLMKDCNQGDTTLIGVGHSMGATALLIAALKNPNQFDALLLYEPIIFPPQLAQPFCIDRKDSPLAVLARKRRNTFPSFSAAYDNFSSKLPFSSFDPEVIRDYLSLGLVPCKDKDEDVLATAKIEVKETRGWRIDETTNEAICLRCTPDFEAFVYNSASDYYIYEKLSSLANIPIIVMSGASVQNQPSSWADDISYRIPTSTLERWEDTAHFGPFEQPRRFADAIHTLSLSL